MPAFLPRPNKRRIPSLSNFALLFILFDVLCTQYWKDQFGLSIEFNPIGLVLLANDHLVALKIALSSIVCFYLHQHNDVDICARCGLVLFFVYLLLFIYHIFLFLYINLTI